jgi:hypothetical protein
MTSHNMTGQSSFITFRVSLVTVQLEVGWRSQKDQKAEQLSHWVGGFTAQPVYCNQRLYIITMNKDINFVIIIIGEGGMGRKESKD